MEPAGEILIFFIQILPLVFVLIVGRLLLLHATTRRKDPPFVPTRGDTLAKIAEALDIKPGDTVYDLGCGNGRMLFYFWKHEPRAKYVGIEYDVFIYLLARLRWRLRGSPANITIHKGNIFETDLTMATKIYGYLFPHTLEKLLPKLQKEFHGTFGALAFSFPDTLQPRAVVELSKTKGGHGEHLLRLYDFGKK